MLLCWRCRRRECQCLTNDLALLPKAGPSSSIPKAPTEFSWNCWKDLNNEIGSGFARANFIVQQTSATIWMFDSVKHPNCCACLLNNEIGSGFARANFIVQIFPTVPGELRWCLWDGGRWPGLRQQREVVCQALALPSPASPTEQHRYSPLRGRCDASPHRVSLKTSPGWSQLW